MARGRGCKGLGRSADVNFEDLGSCLDPAS
jgi:hypothetical protein